MGEKRNPYDTTLDNKHSKQLEEFEYDAMVLIPQLRRERRLLEDEWVKWRMERSEKEEEEEEEGRKEREERGKIREYVRRRRQPRELMMQEVELWERIKGKMGEIRKLRKKRRDYYAQNAEYIFAYFKNKQLIGQDRNVRRRGSKMRKMHELLCMEEKEDDDEEGERGGELEELGVGGGGVGVGVEGGELDVVQRYLCNMSEQWLDLSAYVVSADVCKYCRRGELITMENDGVMVCNVCAVNTVCLTETDKPSYKEPPKEVSFYAYKRQNHFKEIVAQFQGKETTHIPEEVFVRVRNQVRKERIPLEKLSYYRMKDILKNMGYNKYYEHIFYIKKVALNIKPPQMSVQLEEKLFSLFNEILAPYGQVCPPTRTNLLSYTFILYKLCEKLGEYKYLREIPLLKDPEKINDQDDTWRKICKILKWPFRRTVQTSWGVDMANNLLGSFVQCRPIEIEQSHSQSQSQLQSQSQSQLQSQLQSQSQSQLQLQLQSQCKTVEKELEENEEEEEEQQQQQKNKKQLERERERERHRRIAYMNDFLE